ncbi:helix-turn-helix domain-containing protein [Marinobacterium lutimaris]|uniref:Helix-turn-helix n=1 Tax=Marinobacterium lutimaris TaxID=568106 RepID=A0A1H5XV49_9GAMM|nr:hypothetical protein [Marinobacterium lutimaris]SEG15538.1 hypothetical protein SAMN05444390_1011514 [Marinobacterium lutimaris]
MKLSKWLKDHTAEERKALATAAGTTVAYLYQLAGGHRTPSYKLANAIERKTNGEVPANSYFEDEEGATAA